MRVTILNNQNKQGTRILFISKDEIQNSEYKEKLEKYNFKGKGAFFLQDEEILFVGLDKCSKNINNYEESVAIALKSLKSLNIANVYVDISHLGEQTKYIIAQAFLLAGYEFNQFKSEKNVEIDIKINLNGIDSKIINELSIIADSVNIARDIVNTPPNIANSTYLAQMAKELSKDINNVTIDIHSNDFLEKEKMGAFLAVNQGSTSPAYLVHLQYKPTNKRKISKKIVLVGKGLVYDTGGLSLKPADYMTTMKADKGGACAVMSSFIAMAKMQLDVEIHAIMGITDNAIGSKSYRPDDVIYSREGKSIEVRNTDAEGRLVLVDCLSYAQDLKPDILIDFATLTGACVVALGEYTAGVMGHSDELKNDFVKSAMQVNELAHTLPFNRHLKKLLDSKIADICNISSARYGGAITAGLFLSNFIRDEYKSKWLHVDIAGPAFVEKEWGINPYGASGVGVRSCISFVKNNI